MHARTRAESCDYLQLFAGSPIQASPPTVWQILSHTDTVGLFYRLLGCHYMDLVDLMYAIHT